MHLTDSEDYNTEDDEEMDELLNEFVAVDKDFDRSYRSYRKHCRNQKQITGTDNQSHSNDSDDNT